MPLSSKIIFSSSQQLREKITTTIKCKCGQLGTAVWDDEAGLNYRGPKAILLAVSDGFYFRLKRKDYGRTEIVCDVCEGVVRG